MAWKNDHGRVVKILLYLFYAMIFLVFSQPALSSEEAGRKDPPERAIAVSPEYTGIVVPKGEEVRVDLIVANNGRRDEHINLAMPAVPDGWKAEIKTYSFGVRGVYVKGEESKTLTLRLEPEEGTAEGEYRFEIEGRTADGSLVSSSSLLVKLTGQEKGKKKEGVEITTSYPVLRGPTDAKFEFSIEVKNKLEEDAVFNLTAQGPPN